MKNEKLWLLVDGVLKKLHHGKYWTTSADSYKAEIMKAIELLETAKKKLEEEKRNILQKNKKKR